MESNHLIPVPKNWFAKLLDKIFGNPEDPIVYDETNPLKNTIDEDEEYKNGGSKEGI